MKKVLIGSDQAVNIRQVNIKVVRFYVRCQENQTNRNANKYREDIRLQNRDIRFNFSKVIKKIAANIKYEIKWAKVHLDADIEPWAWDTMLAAHTADPRTGITSLKFQAFIQFGIPPYDGDVEKLWKDTTSNEINRIRMADKDALLLYNGMDAGLEYMLALKQMKEAGYVNGI